MANFDSTGSVEVTHQLRIESPVRFSVRVKHKNYNSLLHLNFERCLADFDLHVG